PSRGDNLDRGIDIENKQTNDFVILEDHVEAPEELPMKTKTFFAHAAEKWDAEFYAKINDDVYLNIDVLANALAAHLDKPHQLLNRGYIELADLFFVLTPMMMSVLDPGLSVWMSNMLMTESFAAHLGQQGI
ncbi:hypothetical protein RJ639_026330, partial [Escallonia herrerae]